MPQMRRVVGAYGVDVAVDDGFAQNVAVGSHLYRRVALDGEAFLVVILVAEREVMRTGLSSYLLVFQRDIVSKQRQLRLRRDVHHVQSGSELRRHVDSLCRRLVACLCSTHERMYAGIGYHLAFRCQILAAHGVFVNYLFVLAMCRYQAR